MTRDPHSAGEPTVGPDPVAEFFAREREAVVDRPGSDEHWGEVLGRAQAASRRKWHGLLAAAAATAAIATAVVLNQGGPRLVPPTTTPTGAGTSTTVASHPATTAVTGPTGTSAPPVAPPPTSGPGRTSATGPTATSLPGFPAPVPPLQQVLTVTNAGGGVVYALATAACPQVCPVLLGSSDNGGHWQLLSRFTGYAAAGSGQVISGVRFATPKVGFAYGSTVLRTADGGLTWHPLPYGGGTVLSLETDKAVVWVVSGTCAPAALQGPTPGACGTIKVHRATITAATTSHVAVPSLDAQPTSAWAARAWLALDRSTAYLNISGKLGGSGFTATRISGPATEVARPSACDRGAALTVVPTANDTGTVFGLCAPSGAAGYQVARSPDGGATWQPTGGAALGPVTAAGPVVTGVSAQVLVGINGVGSLVRSADGGATWLVVGRGGTAPVGGWRWVGAAGGGLVYAVQGERSLYVSTDRGLAFHLDATVRH